MTPESTPNGPAAAKSGGSSPALRPSETAAFSPDTATDAMPAAAGGGTPADWVGKVLGKYLISGVLGQGGMGVVFRAHDPGIERDVALKLLAGPLAADATALGRFLGEAKAAG